MLTHGPEGLHPGEQLAGERLARGGVQTVEAQHGLGDAGDAGSVDAFAVDERATATGGGEQFTERGHAGKSGHHFAVRLQADQVGPCGIAAHEIAGAVDGVDDPAAAAA